MSEYIIEWSGIGARIVELIGSVPTCLIAKRIREERRGEEIVRCRDCKRFDSKTDGCWWFSHYEQQGDYSWAEVPSDVEPDGFCAWGERKDA